MTRILQLVFTRSFCASVVLMMQAGMLRADSISAYSPAFDTADISSLTPVYSLTNNPVSLSDSNYFAILKNNRNCLQCFTVLNDFVKIIRKDIPVKYIVITQSDSSSLERKRNHATNKRLMPDLGEHLFTYKGSGKDDYYFGEAGTYTPEVLLIRNRKILRIKYKNLFTYPSMEIAPAAQQAIFNFLK